MTASDLSAFYTSPPQTYVANELLAYYPRTELDSLYWTSGRTNGDRRRHRRAGFLDQTAGDARYLVPSRSGQRVHSSDRAE